MGFRAGRPIALAALVMAAAPGAGAQALWCQPPGKPHCVDRYGAFPDEFDFAQCRSEAEEYRRRIRAYLECLREESEAALRDLDRAIEAFNRRARIPG